MVESAASTSFNSGAFVGVVVANFEVCELGGGFPVGSFDIERLDGMRMISALAEGLAWPVIVVKRLHGQRFTRGSSKIRGGVCGGLWRVRVDYFLIKKHPGFGT